MPDYPHISPDQLSIGLYVHLDLDWMKHPFLFSHFKIRNQDQIDTLRRMGLTRISYDPARSDAEPLPASAPARVAPAPEPAPDPEAQAQHVARLARVERLREIRNRIARAEYEFMRTADTVRNISRNLHTRPQETLQATVDLVERMVGSILSDGDLLIHAMGNKLGDDVYFHSLNVTVLSLMLGRAVGLGADDMQQLGIAAMLHDIGKSEVPHKILAKTEPLTRPEQHLLEQHCVIGAAFARKIGVSENALTAIAQHHEHLDGSGYPNRLSNGQISPLARALVIANTYDNLCNPLQITEASTPAEALARMFAQRRTQFDADMLSTFIRLMGVYPPGSIVQLNNAMPGLVLSINSADPLRPEILVYDPAVPRDEALVINLGTESELKIEKGLRLARLPAAVREYLNPRTHVTYYFTADGQKNPH